MKEVLGLILSGGRGTQLYPLTKHRSRAAVPFAGKYRLIDIPLSNCLNSGLNRIYVLTQFQSVSLHRHIGNTYKFDPFNRGFVEVLAAQVTNEAADWYRGTADAIRQNIRYIHEDGADAILVLSDDQLYRFDFRHMLQSHQESGADVTLAVVPVTREQATGLGIVRTDERGRLTAFVEKPQTERELEQLHTPAAWLEQRGALVPGREYLGNMSVYLFTRQALFDLLNAEPRGDDLARDIFPRCHGSHHVQTYLFTGSWDHLETIRAYQEANLALAGDQPPFDFHSPEGVIYTRMRNLPASRVSAASMKESLISDGCIIGAGARMERCVLGVRSVIGRDVVLRDAVILGANFFETEKERAENSRQGRPNVGIGEHSVLEGVIVDKNCRIGRNVTITNRRALQNHDGDNYVIRDGLVVIPHEVTVPDGTVI